MRVWVEGFRWSLRGAASGFRTVNSDSSRSPSATPESPARSLPRRFGRYELLEELGRGGAGVIFKARQPDLDRLCAVKMLHESSGGEASRSALLLAEARAAAVLDHPNIVGIYEVGDVEGHPFYSMEFVPGENLAAFVRSRMVPASKAADYVEKIASAIEYAHSRGVTHCDLKPANVLIDPRDEPQITDFGLARRMGVPAAAAAREDPTAGAGSPNFMAPEQASDRFGSIGVRTDVFGIGAILYYLLMDRPPFRGETVSDTIRAVTQEDPVRPRALRPGVPIDLETICLKCLEKRPVRRYQSAGEVAEELRRFLRDEPIHARRISQVERAWRFARRHPLLSGFAGATLALMTIIAVGSPIAAYRINQARELADQQRRRAESNELRVRRQLYAVQFQEAVQAAESGDARRARELLAGLRPGGESPTTNSEDFRGWEWRYLAAQVRDPEVPGLPVSQISVLDVAAIDRGRSLLVLRADGTIDRLTHAKNQNVTQTIARIFGEPSRTNQFGRLIASPDGSRLALTRFNLDSTNSDVVLLEAHGCRELGRVTIPGGIPNLAFSPDGSSIVLAVLRREGDRFRVGVERWIPATASRSLLVELGVSRMFNIPVFDGGVTRLAVGMDDGKIELHDLKGQQAKQVLSGHPFEPGWAVLICSLEFFPGGRRLASVGVDKTLRIWDLETGSAQVLRGHTDAVYQVAVSPDARLVATASRDRTIRFWDPVGGIQKGLLTGGGSVPPNIGFTPDGSTLVAIGDADGKRPSSVQFYDVPQSLKRVLPEAEVDPGILWAELLPDSQHWWTVSAEKRWTLYRLGVASPLKQFAGTNAAGLRARAFDPVGRRIASVSEQGVLTLEPLDPGTRRQWSLGRSDPITSVRFSLDGRLLAVGFGASLLTGPESRQWLQIWELESGQRLSEFETFADRFLFSPDSRWLATSNRHGNVRLHRIGSGATRDLNGFAASIQVLGLAFSPDASELAAGAIDGTIKRWNTKTGQELGSFDSQTSGVLSLIYSPSGDRLLSGSLDGALQIWDPRNRLRLATFHTHSKGITSLAFRDADTLVSGDLGAIRLWKAKSAAPDSADDARKLL